MIYILLHRLCELLRESLLTFSHPCPKHILLLCSTYKK